MFVFISKLIDFVFNICLGLEIKYIDHSVDFYVASYTLFNNCTNELKIGGIVPVSGSAPNTMVLQLSL